MTHPDRADVSFLTSPPLVSILSDLLSEVYSHLCGGRVINHFGKTTLGTFDRESNLNLTVISSPVYYESSALEHAATKAAKQAWGLPDHEALCCRTVFTPLRGECDDAQWGHDCPVSCLCHISTYDDLPMKRWLIDTVPNNGRPFNPTLHPNEALYEDEAQLFKAPYESEETLKMAMCVFQQETAVDMLLSSLPSDTQVLTILQGRDSGNISLEASHMHGLEDLIALDIQGYNYEKSDHQAEHVSSTRNNKLTELPLGIFNNVPAKMIRLEGNPWHCSCAMKDWQPAAINKIKQQIKEVCQFQYDKGSMCSQKSDVRYVYERRVAPRCETPTKYKHWSVFQVLRKELRCNKKLQNKINRKDYLKKKHDDYEKSIKSGFQYLGNSFKKQSQGVTSIILVVPLNSLLLQDS
uniref:Uncharacterized protein n=1 Tax=Timema tahoe TaxID=61484 RepID=A0A7R9IE83_9NEOP|nr:unnamed protein product [Timema tahoe]